MIHPKSPQIIFDNIWKPLVLVLPKNQRAFLVHPGTTLAPIELSPGWHWHWPLLTSIRLVTGDKITYRFSATRAHFIYSDESITAVSRDHQLYTIQGQIEIGIDLKADEKTLSKLNRHSAKRLFRPLVRQAVRQSIATLESNSITADALADSILESSASLFSANGLLIFNVQIEKVESYKPQVMQKPQP